MFCFLCVNWHLLLFHPSSRVLSLVAWPILPAWLPANQLFIKPIWVKNLNRVQNDYSTAGKPITGWTLPHKSLIKKNMPYRIIYNPILWGHFLNLGSLLSDDCSLFQVGINLTSKNVKYDFVSSHNPQTWNYVNVINLPSWLIWKNTCLCSKVLIIKNRKLSWYL